MAEEWLVKVIIAQKWMDTPTLTTAGVAFVTSAGGKAKVVANKLVLPPELRRKISPALYTLIAQRSAFMRYFGLGLAAFCLYGPIAGASDHNGFRYLVGPWICPSMIAAFHSFFPFRPYRGVIFVDRTRDIDTTDPVSMRLVSVYRSSRARLYVWRQSLKLSTILFVIMGLLALPVQHSLNWSFPYSLYDSLPSNVSIDWFWLGWGGGILGSYLALMTDYITWGLMNWASQEVRTSN
jgi:hypothetical protein